MTWKTHNLLVNKDLLVKDIMDKNKMSIVNQTINDIEEC